MLLTSVSYTLWVSTKEGEIEARALLEVLSDIEETDLLPTQKSKISAKIS